jgi:uncharacterized small protein (DUF1192 family)
MNDDDLPLSLRRIGAAQAFDSLMTEDLEPMSVEELAERIERLEGEITRVRGMIDRKKSRLSAAEALFSFKGS